ncbi:hypothetical protein [Salegentibacter chungangensis]|uniref:Nicotinate-nucleotide adenylyltransferase n=1 Tax=Salegentibacter chungangensis TaxID=1335724 RepID=A0ABW3NSB9_9FLAO
MKTLVLGILLLGLSSLGYAQRLDVERVMLEDVKVSTLNSDYLHAIQDDKTPLNLIGVQRLIASYDINDASFYDPENDRYEVYFKTENGNSTVYYDGKGKILKSHEYYKDVKVPIEIWKQIYKDNEGWSMIKNKYSSTYSDSELRNRKYKVFLSDGVETKKVVLNIN